MSEKIFIFDSKTERQTGALTMAIFTICFMLFGLLIELFGSLLVGISLTLVSKVIPIGGSLDLIPLTYLNKVVITLMIIIPIMAVYHLTPVMFQLLSCYVLLSDGSFVKLRWQPRGSRRSQAYVLSRTVDQHIPSTNASQIYDTMKRLSGIVDGIAMMQEPQVIMDYINGNAAYHNYIITYPMNKIKLIKNTKKVIVVTADTLVKGKQKRKKFKIFRMYNDMELISSICEGGLNHEYY